MLVSGTSGSDGNSSVIMVERFHEFNNTNGSANYSGDPAYRITPTPISIQLELNEKNLPAPKGEMAAGPRTIGISAEPLTFAIAIAALAVALSGLWYLTRRKVNDEGPGEKEDDDGQ